MNKCLHYASNIRTLLGYSGTAMRLDMDELYDFNDNVVRAAAAYVIHLVGRLQNEEVSDPFHISRVMCLEELEELLNVVVVAQYLQEHDLRALADGHALVVHWRHYAG